jgi:hypothetical protein
MANYNWSTNQSPATGAIAMYTLLATFIAAGWADVKDSDGTTYAPAGGQITSGAAGANGLANSLAWFVVAGGGRQYCVQRSSASNAQWRIKYSFAAGFTGGTPGAARVPSATDEVVLLGGGTDAAPTFATLYQVDGTYRMNCCVGKLAGLVSSVFYQMCWPNGTPSGTGMLWFCDIMSAGTYPTPNDTDPSVQCLQTNLNPWVASNLVQTNGGLRAMFWNGSAQQFQSLNAYPLFEPNTVRYSAPAISSGQGDGPNSYTGKDDLIPVPYGRPTNLTVPNGFKGIGSLFYWGTVFRSNADVVSVATPTARDWLWMNGSLVPWDGSIPVP